MRFYDHFVSAEASDFEEPGALCGAKNYVASSRKSSGNSGFLDRDAT